VRDYWRGEAPPKALAPRLCGSPGEFRRRGRQPWASANFITAHDGFTLNDLVSYNDKHNEANGEENRDGHSHNRSWNHGAEGPEVDEPVRALRKRQMKNLLATLLLSQGTPMLLAGDEFGRTQQGNNNAYCQDNEISWVHWNHDDREQRLINFVRKLTGLREKYPILRRARWLTGEYNEELEVKDVTWINTAGEEMRQDQWDDPHTRVFGMLLDGRAGNRHPPPRRARDAAHHLQSMAGGREVQAAGHGRRQRLDAARRHQLPDATEDPQFAIGHVYR
jgi:glycogen operon protein